MPPRKTVCIEPWAAEKSGTIGESYWLKILLIAEIDAADAVGADDDRVPVAGAVVAGGEDAAVVFEAGLAARGDDGVEVAVATAEVHRVDLGRVAGDPQRLARLVDDLERADRVGVDLREVLGRRGAVVALEVLAEDEIEAVADGAEVAAGDAEAEVVDLADVIGTTLAPDFTSWIRPGTLIAVSVSNVTMEPEAVSWP